MLTFTFDWILVLQLLVSTILPILVGLVTKKSTNPGRKAVLLALLALITSVLTEWLNAATAGTAYDIGQGLLLALPTFFIAVAMHYGLWKPTGVSEGAQALFDKNTITVHETRR